jgi:hypothetical protein
MKMMGRSTGPSGRPYRPTSALEAVWRLTLDYLALQGERVDQLRLQRSVSALNDAGARCLLVGGYALAVHATPRFSKVIHVWIEPTAENAARVMDALRAFGAPLGAVSAADLARPGIVFQIGVPPNRIDLMTSIDGVGFDEAWRDRVSTSYGDQTIAVIGRQHLIANKRATGRAQDALDADLLERGAGPATP